MAGLVPAIHVLIADVLIAGENLIRVAVTRDPAQAIPISGSYTGTAADFLDMTVTVTVIAEQTP